MEYDETTKRKFNMKKSQDILWYKQAAGNWLEALPVGNGHLGAMVFGDPIRERIQLTEESIWTGAPVPQVPEGARDGLDKARRMMQQGEVIQAQNVIAEKVLSPRHGPRSQQPLGDITIQFHGRRVRTSLFGPDARYDPANMLGYRRELDLSRGVASCSWNYQQSAESAEVFCSVEEDVLVARYQARKPGSLICSISLSREAGATIFALGDDTLAITGQASHRGKQRGVRFTGVLKAEVKGGSCVSDTSGLEISGADAFILYFGVATDYNAKDPLSPRRHDLVGEASAKVDSALTKGYERILERHLSDHLALYSRVKLDLGSSPISECSIDERRAAIKQGEEDKALDALQFNFGRYLLISSSRPGTLPANLQGVWNHELAAPWDCDYHTNINMQMNYWQAEVCNLSECHEPFFDFFDNLLPEARKSAAAIGCRGAFMGVSTDVWHYTSFYGEFSYGMWVMGLAWCAQHYMEHYRFTGDRKFLATRAYPMLRECALFFLDWLVEDPATGQLVSGPCTSPENVFYTDRGEKASLSMGCSMDQQIIRDCFTSTLEAAGILGESDEVSAEINVALAKIASPAIAEDGRLMEWSRDYKEVDRGHRHMSHLFGLHPGHQYHRGETPAVMAAIEKTLAARLAGGCGNETGWSSIWMSHFRSRLHDGEKALENLRIFSRKLTCSNLFGSAHKVFQIDANLGYPSAVVEMLLQSHTGTLELLPALPGSWVNGSVTGLCARGGFEIAMTWEDGRLKNAAILSRLGNKTTVTYGQTTIFLEAKAGETVELSFQELVKK